MLDESGQTFQDAVLGQKFCTQNDFENEFLRIKIQGIKELIPAAMYSFQSYLFSRIPDKSSANTYEEFLIKIQHFTHQHNRSSEIESLYFIKKYYTNEITIPILINKLSYNSCLAFEIWIREKSSREETLLGGTTISIFDEDLIMRSGQYELKLYRAKPDMSNDSRTPGLVKLPRGSNENYESMFSLLMKDEAINKQKEEEVSINDHTFKKNLIPMPYLDLRYLQIEFPVFDCPTIYSDLLKEKSSILINGYPENHLSRDWDFDFGYSDPLNDQITLLFRDEDSSLAKDRKPDLETLIRINKILFSPTFGLAKSEDRDVIWKYRYSLINRKEALVKFLHCILWEKEHECKEAITLMRIWEKIDYHDALDLLSYYFAANEIYNKRYMQKVREYALEILEKVENAELSMKKFF